MRLVVPWAAEQNRSSELMLSALVRARFCELLSPRIQHGDSDLFLVGLLSRMDAILEKFPRPKSWAKSQSTRRRQQYF